ncbi:iron-containing alcohol dehydrogenase [Pseudoflavonifractor phocaeensis]|uniref:iron-containing alcohol dehydrogenase n=1 Tax=Pseudoflavonifractor phocaeensis TaxID=1870988 RepID=UPI001F3EFAE9|nr:iron-containing alcohol dehydrogenase [Pseudoflavonifractor phocaeensis]MCF2661750.1 iron-containing alcohol dehydrogenase [Pseudoflavonifractor phocaeensis]
MQAFEFHSPTKIVFGRGTAGRAGQLTAQWGGSRVLVVYGGQSAVKSGLLDRIKASLEEAGLTYETLGGVKPNPRLGFARDGVKQALAFGADFILAVGGGSVIDTAKAISAGAANPDLDLWDIWTRKVPLSKNLPTGVVLTIPAAGSESSDSAVLTNDETKVKRGLSTPLNRPRFAIMDPELTFTLPPYQVACGVVDIMMHTMDRYFNPITTNELTDEIAQGLLRCVIRNGRRALDCPGDYQAMSELMWAGSLSHNGLTGLGGVMDFAPHQLGHELSAMFDAAHGATLSAVWDSWARYCCKTNPARFAQFGTQVWGLDPAGKDDEALAREAIEATANYFRSLNMPTCFSELGCGVLPEETLQELAHRCTFFDTRTIGSFQVLGYEDILAIYRMANH